MTTDAQQTTHTPPPWGLQRFGSVIAVVGQHSDRPIILDGSPFHSLLRVRENGRMRPIRLDDATNHPDVRLLLAAPGLRRAANAHEAMDEAANTLQAFLDGKVGAVEREERIPILIDELRGWAEDARSAIAKARDT